MGSREHASRFRHFAEFPGRVCGTCVFSRGKGEESVEERPLEGWLMCCLWSGLLRTYYVLQGKET